MSGTQVQCEDTACAYWIAGRCKAEHVSLVIEQGDLICDTYEEQELVFDYPDDDDRWEMDWKCNW